MPASNKYLRATETPWYKGRWGIFAVVAFLIAVLAFSLWGIGGLALTALPCVLIAALLSADEQLREHQT